MTDTDVAYHQRNAVRRARLRNAGLPIKTTALQDIERVNQRAREERVVDGTLASIILTKCAAGEVPT